MRLREALFGPGNPAWPRDRHFFRKGRAGVFRTELSEDEIAMLMQRQGELLAALGYPLA